jgi:hypothetical protein
VSATLATYGFLPWLRRGMASQITRKDGEMTGAPRADVTITLTLDAAGDRRDIVVPVALYGPGEVGVIDRRVVIRTTPRADENDAEPNYFTAIEFDQADLPWRYMPASADARGRLRPWLVLAVVTAGEISHEAPPSDGRLPALTIASAAALPRLSQSWAWAHTQIEAFDPSSESMSTIVREHPHRVRARLLAPRRLAPNTAYRALLVPAFERGRRAGLGETLDDTIDALTPAWTDDAVNIRLPVYYEWSFQTGVKGDFEFLARRLRARPVDDALGLSDMDVLTPDPALPAASAEPLAFEGALVSASKRSTLWPAAERAPFVGALAGMLNQPTENLASTDGEATVAPPLWGRWHAAADRLLDDPAAQPQWFHELNADPRWRVAAGLGAEIVRRLDQQLMAAAWDQVEGVLEANAELRRAQLAREASAKLHQKHFARLDADAFLMVTAPLQARFMTSSVTMRETLRRTPIPPGALDGQMRRVLRPGGAVAKRARREAAAAPSASLLSRLNSGAVRARPPRPTPEGMVSPNKLGDAPRTKRPPPGLARALLFLALIMAIAAIVLGVLGSFVFAGLAAAAGIGAWFVSSRLARSEQRRREEEVAIATAATPELIAKVVPPTSYVPAFASSASIVVVGHTPVAPPDMASGSQAARAASENFRAAYSDLAAEITVAPNPGPVLTPGDLPALTNALLTKMDPRKTIVAGIKERLVIADWIGWDFEDPLEPVMAAPEFDTPMYEPLRDYGQSWLMPGVGRIPPDTVTLVVSNQRFIEAYMLGLSHEMARELLYHEYPTDQRGTYFRQFWDVRGALAPGGAPLDPEKLRDIKRIHKWATARGLGANCARDPAPREGHLVFLIKGELLRRYPNTLVYAVKAKIEGGRRALGPEERYPVFEGRLDPDIAFFGFDFLPSEVRGDPDPTKDQGWFFILQDQPTEPLFGLDADDGRYAAQPTSWSDLNWAHLAADSAALEGLGYINLDADLPDTSLIAPAAGDPPLAWHAEQGRGPAGGNASDLAHITLQRPFRVAIHGLDMLPE